MKGFVRKLETKEFAVHLFPAIALAILLWLAAGVLPARGDDYSAQWQQVNELVGSGANAKALELAQSTLRQMEMAWEADDPRLIEPLRTIAMIQESLRRLDEQEPVLLRMLTLAQKAFGPAHEQVQTARGWLTMNYTERKMPEKAAALFKDDPVIRLGELNRKETSAEALAFGEKTLAEFERWYGRDDPRLLDLLKQIAQVHFTREEKVKQEAVLQRVLSIAEEAEGADGFQTRLALDSLAHHYQLRGMPGKAEPLFRRALAIAEKTLADKRARGETIYPHESGAIGDECKNLGQMLVTAGNYLEAEPFYLRALRALEENKETLPFQLYGMCNALCELYQKLGDVAEAARFGEREIVLREEEVARGKKDDENTLYFRIRLQGERLLRIGEFARAEKLLLRAFDYMARTGGPNNVETITILWLLSDLYESLGDAAQADGYFYSFAVMGARRWRLPGPDFLLAERRALRSDPATARTLIASIGRDLVDRDVLVHAEVINWLTDTVAKNCAWVGEHELAIQLSRKAAALWQRKHGPQNTSTAWTLARMAEFHSNAKEFDAAIAALDEAAAMLVKVLGHDDPQVAFVLSRLIQPCLASGRPERAERAAAEALEITRKNFPPDHREAVLALSNLAICEIASGKRASALEHARAADVGEKQTLVRMLAFADEAQRLDYLRQLNCGNLFATLGDARALGEVLVRTKGLALDSMVEDRVVAAAGGNPARRVQLAEIAKLKRQMADLVFGARADEPAERQQSRELQQTALAAKLRSCETAVAREVAGLGRTRRSMGVTLDLVRERIPADGVLVDFFRYAKLPWVPREESRYGALLVRAEGEPVWIDLAPADRIDSLMSRYRASAMGHTDAATLKRSLDELWKELWTPIAQALPKDTHTLVLCPDGELNFLSFATLLGPAGRFLCEDFQLRYVAAARDLLAKPASTTGRRFVIFGDPQFGRETAAAAPVNSVGSARRTTRNALLDLDLPPLAGAAEEARLVATAATGAGWSTELFLGEAATEERLAHAQSPGVLHLATHGFLLQEKATANGEPARPGPLAKIPANAMLRSGFVLAGAATTLSAWKRGSVPQSDDDGIVTAEDVGTLQLDGTWLATLSACDTAVGEVRAGEGVLGLRRGFVQAGARNLFMTLWPIDDETTVDIMLDFYAQALASGDAPQALADVQRKWLVELREKRGLLHAVNRAGAFILSSQGATAP